MLFIHLTVTFQILTFLVAHQIEYMPQDKDPLAAEDYITVRFEIPVVPRNVCIYEVYNPGSIVRIWGTLSKNESCWILLWEGKPQKCTNKSRKFHPKIKFTNKLINTIRLEFNQSELDYHTSIDAVLLGGYMSESLLLFGVLKEQLPLLDVKQIKSQQEDFTKFELVCYENKEDYFSNLPYELVTHIFQYLDLKSLCRCAQVNKRWSEIARDAALYTNLSLKRYWYIMNGKLLRDFLPKIKGIKKLDLSWCGNNCLEFPLVVNKVLIEQKTTLTHLSLNNCEYVNNSLIENISRCKELIDLRLKNTTFWRISTLDELNKLVSLDLTDTMIQDNDLIKILRSNPNLKHLIIDLCKDLRRLDHVVAVAAQHNKQLESWSSWKCESMTYEGARSFGQLHQLTDLDLGWCLLTTHPGDCLHEIAKGCPKLRRLILAEWRGITDVLLLPIIKRCSKLEELDLLGIRGISPDIVRTAFKSLPALKLLDLSYCMDIDQDYVMLWREEYPHITIQRSYQYIVNEYWMN
ncbi:F-box/LRR-repeat protein 4 isoform X2 [Aethina tumida]|uniref:F-box/LRR-repeat protein 4 isoform X2 n=1 Tax=Aethina tumida TaxID=116153 RepID=UPI0021479E40|nr:F-box/LRR-repeat protein 4 isoform X2 [Aethina tumida]